MANLNGILNHYRQTGWLTVPGLYNTDGKDNRCKICNWYNDHATERECQGCSYAKMKDEKAKKAIFGVDVRKLKLEEYQVFQIVAKQIIHGETPYITVEEFAEECKKRIEDEESKALQKTEQQKIAEILYR